MSLADFNKENQNAGNTVNGKCLIDGQWIDPEGIDGSAGGGISSVSPCGRFTIWQGAESSSSQVDQAVDAARVAWKSWLRTSLNQRIEYVKKYQQIAIDRKEELALLIARETGKPYWEALTEAGAVAGKADLSIAAIKERRDTQSMEVAGGQAVVRFKPHGVMGVLGPFNFPAHLPNGHIIPALLAGNTVVFKPSELTPAVGQWMAEAWQEAGLPAGVLNFVPGGRTAGAAIVEHQKIDGLLFTGSSQAGVHFHKSFGGNPEKLLALEMGGHNPLVVCDCNDIDAAAYQIILSAYLTAGQRCTCARRLILVKDSKTDDLVESLAKRIAGIEVGLFDRDPEPFYGTVISEMSGKFLQSNWKDLLQKGGKAITDLKPVDGYDALLTPGLVDVSSASDLEDHEWFGPILKLTYADDLQDAIGQANDTRYGLSAGLLTDKMENWDEFLLQIRAGVVNLNRQTTGASGKLPFGGCGRSGNHRPSGYYAADYCSFPVASMESEQLTLPESKMQGIRWE